MSKFQLKISLKGAKPPIWRRVVIDADLPLEDLHLVIQTVMPWSDSHLHQFIKNRKLYSCPSLYDDFWGENDTIDYSDMTVSDLLSSEKDKITYEYDFGDGWEHDILLEKILPSSSSNSPRAMYITGKNACPPEDCGGIYGYMALLEIINDPTHENYKYMREWMGLEEGEVFDPKDIGFDPDEINDEFYGI